tara:strand:+ start:4011 stop:4127 length:117 start_codon:yes stop_codon:yes gene_type:complete
MLRESRVGGFLDLGSVSSAFKMVIAAELRGGEQMLEDK